MIETKVDGDPDAVAASATWLRTLAKGLESAGDVQQDARNEARRSWEGETASSYQGFTSDLLKATDKHEQRVKRAATALDQYAVRLRRFRDEMADILGWAGAGGLTIVGTVIHPPPDVPAGAVEAGSPEEAARKAAVAKVELWNELVEDADKAWSDFTDWVDAEMPGDVADAREKDGSDSFGEVVQKALPNFAAGSGAGLTGLALLERSQGLRAEVAEIRRRSKVSKDPRVAGFADTPAGRAKVDDLLGKAEWLGRGGRLLSGPAGIAIDVGFGVKEGAESGDWDRAGLTTSASVLTGLGVAGAVGLGVVTAPAWATVVAGGALAAGASWAAGEVYDNWDGITDKVDETWDDAKDLAGKAWDKVTPW